MRERLRWVTRFLLIALLGAASLFGSAETRPEPEAKTGGEFVLSAAQPVAHIPIPSAVWKEKRTSLQVNVVKIRNSLDTAFSIAVSLEPRSVAGTKSKAKIAAVAIGVLGIYPAGQTGSYRLETSSALRRMQASGADTDHACLRLELRRIHPRESQDGLEVTLSAPQWLPAN